MPRRPDDQPLTPIHGTAKYALCTAGASVHIGGKHDPANRFLPEIHATKPGWNDDTFLTVRHTDARKSRGEKHRIVKGIGKKPDLDAIEWKIGGRTHHFIQGSVEHTITYDSQADLPTNRIEIYDVEFPANGLRWCLQPALTPEEQTRGCRRPDNVVGSYAVYGPRSGNLLDTQGNPIYECTTGKFCHVYRPQLIAANGTKAWCTQHYDPAAKQLAISLPADFTASAQYPLTLDPTFGFSGEGETAGCVIFPTCAVEASLLYTASAGDRVTDFCIFGIEQGNVPTAALYSVVSGPSGARLASPAPFPVLSIYQDNPDWFSASTVQSVSQTMQAGATYGVAVAPSVDEGLGGGMLVVWNDFFPNDNISIQIGASGLPTNWSGGDYLPYRYSWYAVYTAGTTGGPFPHHTRRRMLGGMIGMGA